LSTAAQTYEPVDDDIALRAIVEGVEAETGDRFFASLVQHLAAALQVQYAFVSELSSDRRSFRTLALWGHGQLMPNIEVLSAGTPCESVLDGQMSHHPCDLQRLFPLDVGLVSWKAESYCGVPLLDGNSTTVGHLAIIDDRPMPDGPRGLAIMRIFAARARAEIDRLRAEAAVRESEERLASILDSALDAVIACDAQQQIEYVNRAAPKIFACEANAMVGHSLRQFLTGSLQRHVDDGLLSLARPQTPAQVLAGTDLFAKRANGAAFAVEATLSRLPLRDRNLYTLIVRDIEERRLAAERLRDLQAQNIYLQEEIRAVHNAEEIVGQSAVLRAVLEQVKLVAATDSAVLILGETGTGKELVARAVHANSPRQARPLIKVNCAALPAGLVESELFGHERGAFTGASERRIGRFELADGGTIFLDEIGEVPLPVQAKLLRVLQEQEFERVGGSKTLRVDVRLIAATNRDLEQAVALGTFRQDLLYRLNVFPVRLPPLRERVDDIPLLVHYFVGRFVAKIGRRISRVPRAVMERLMAYEWPGNVRELENIVERAVIISCGAELQMPPELAGVAVAQPVMAAAPAPLEFRAAIDASSLEDVERQHIKAMLRRTQWRIEGPTGAASLLQLRPSTLRSRMKKLGIRRGDED
jgi:PAS domain S-box-containing protein